MVKERSISDSVLSQRFQKLKIEHAKILLRESEKNITEISEMLGFQTIHYFSRFFKKHTGGCPREYAKTTTLLEELIDI